MNCNFTLNGDWGKKFLDEIQVGEDDLDFVLNGKTFMAPWTWIMVGKYSILQMLLFHEDGSLETIAQGVIQCLFMCV